MSMSRRENGRRDEGMEGRKDAGDLEGGRKEGTRRKLLQGNGLGELCKERKKEGKN